MPNLNFVKQGQGPIIVLSHALGCDLHMWDEVAATLQERYTVLRYDHRGHGQTLAEPGAFSMNELADDAAALIAQQAGGPVHFVGLSMGGMTAQALAVRHPALIKSLVIANSAAGYDEAARAGWKTRVDTVLSQGMSAIADGAMQRWFTPEFRADEHGGRARVVSLRAGLEALAPVPYAAACMAVSDIDFVESNRRIACPVLVIAGTRDEATPLVMSEMLAQSIPGARLRTIETAHLSAVEQPMVFAQLVTEFLSSL